MVARHASSKALFSPVPEFRVARSPDNTLSIETRPSTVDAFSHRDKRADELSKLDRLPEFSSLRVRGNGNETERSTFHRRLLSSKREEGRWHVERVPLKKS